MFRSEYGDLYGDIKDLLKIYGYLFWWKRVSMGDWIEI